MHEGTSVTPLVLDPLLDAAEAPPVPKVLPEPLPAVALEELPEEPPVGVNDPIAGPPTIWQLANAALELGPAR